MNRSKKNYRWSYLLTAALGAIALSGTVLALTENTGGFRSFCVGSCDPEPYAWETSIAQPAASPLNFSFSIDFDEVAALEGMGFMFLDVLDSQGLELFHIRAVRGAQGGEEGLTLSLEYTVAPGLVGSLALGYSVDGADCFWVERTEATPGNPLPTGFLVTRSRPGQTYDTGSVRVLGSPALVRQGVLELFGEPQGDVLISDAKIDKKCGP